MFRHIQICWERWSDTRRSVTGATGVPARNSPRLWNKGRFWLTGSLITSSLSGQTASTVGRLLYYSHSGCFSLRENNNDKDCRLLTAFSNPSSSSSSTCTHRPSLCVLTTVEEAGHPSSVGQGSPRKEKQRDHWEDIVLWQLAGFFFFFSRPCVNCRDSLLRGGLGHCESVPWQREFTHMVLFHVSFGCDKTVKIFLQEISVLPGKQWLPPRPPQHFSWWLIEELDVPFIHALQFGGQMKLLRINFMIN